MSNPDDDRDEIAEMADRFLAMKEPNLEFEIDFASLTSAEQDELVTVMDGKVAHRQDTLESLKENIAILTALRELLVSRAFGMPLGEALQAGYISVLDVVESIRSADPLPQQPPA